MPRVGFRHSEDSKRKMSLNHTGGFAPTSAKVALVEGGSVARRTVKKLLIREGLIPYRCKCGNKGEWLGKPLMLRLDHKNGVNDDNRLENLQFVCPNCDSQSEHYCGRNKIKRG